MVLTFLSSSNFVSWWSVLVSIFSTSYFKPYAPSSVFFEKGTIFYWIFGYILLSSVVVKDSFSLSYSLLESRDYSYGLFKCLRFNETKVETALLKSFAGITVPLGTILFCFIIRFYIYVLLVRWAVRGSFTPYSPESMFLIAVTWLGRSTLGKRIFGLFPGCESYSVALAFNKILFRDH